MIVAILMHTGWTEQQLDRTKMGVVQEVIRQMHVQARQQGGGGGMPGPRGRRGY